MNHLLGYAIVFLLTVVLHALLRRPALAIGLVDNPTARKRHRTPVPLIGGLAMFLAFATMVAWLWPIPVNPYGSLFAGMFLMVFVGVLDDRYTVSPVGRFSAQIFALLLMTSWTSVQVTGLGDLFGLGPVELGHWAIPYTVLVGVGLINAVNMVDGFDGLAGGITVTALVWLAVIAALVGINGTTITLKLSLACAIAGFLVYNIRNPWRRSASVFMGDSGSTMLGFALVWFAVHTAQASGGTIPPMTFAWVLALPVFDAVTVIIRRVAKGRNPLNPARDHLHHSLLRTGIGITLTTNLLILTSVLYGAIGVAGWRLGVAEHWLFAGFIATGFAQLWFTARGWRKFKIWGIAIRRR